MSKVLSKKDFLSMKDIVATNPSDPFGGGVAPMGGGTGGPASGTATTSPHQGPPPAGSNPSTTWNCPRCNRMCDDCEELEKHLWRDHGVSTRRKHRE